MRGKPVTKEIAAATAFSGELVSVEPAYPSYNAGEEVFLRIHSHTEADNLSWYIPVWWTCYRIFSEDGVLLYSDTRAHSTAPWTSHDEADDLFLASIGVMPNKTFWGQVELSGKAGTVPPGPEVLCDIEAFSVPLKDGAPTPPPPDGGQLPGEIPWKWICIGGGALLGLIILSQTRR